MPMPTESKAERTRRLTDERRFLKSYDPGTYDPIAVTVDAVVFALSPGSTVEGPRRTEPRPEALEVLLIQRGEHPERGQWALPGGFLRNDERPTAAVRRELSEETSVVIGRQSHLEPLPAFGEPGRDPRLHVVTLPFAFCTTPAVGEPTAGTDAAEARWWPAADAIAGPLAFDHSAIVQVAVDLLGERIASTTWATHLLGSAFTIDQLRNAYQDIWNQSLDPANFRRKVEQAEFLAETGPAAEWSPRRGPSPSWWQGPKHVTNLSRRLD